MKPITVLLVDDEPAYTETLAKRLTKRGLAVKTAGGGREALDLAGRVGQELDAVVLDVKMPDLDGLTTLVELKKIAPEVEVILLTGQGTVDSAIEGMRRGAFDFLTKPCEAELLAAKIEQAARSKRSRRPQG